MSEELLDDMSLLIFKNQLLCGEMKDLKEFYKDERCFLNFLDTIALVSQREPAFFLLSTEIKDRIIQIIDLYKYSANEEVLAYINEILIYLNGVDNIPEELANLMVKSYMEFHEKLRRTKFNDVYDFLSALSYDAIFISALDDDNMDSLTNHDLNISSFNYLICTSPDFFKDKKVMDRANILLDEERKDAKVFSKKKNHIKDLRRTLNFIKKGE